MTNRKINRKSNQFNNYFADHRSYFTAKLPSCLFHISDGLALKRMRAFSDFEIISLF